MPELPEVETIVRDLSKVLPGEKLIGAKAVWAKSLNVTTRGLLLKLKKQPVKKVSRSGKALIINFGERSLMIHLKMTGQLVWCSEDSCLSGGHPIVGVGMDLPNKFTRVELIFESGKLYFNDVRKFGWLKLLDETAVRDYIEKNGLEPLDRKAFTLHKFRVAFERKTKSKIKAALLDQKKVVGIGNIYADESLFQAGIKPERLVGSLTETEWEELWQSIIAILKKSIKYRGTSFSDYRDARGKKGNFVGQLRVYGRGGQPCLKCGGIIKKKRLAGRGTHWCDNCQK